MISVAHHVPRQVGRKEWRWWKAVNGLPTVRKPVEISPQSEKKTWALFRQRPKDVPSQVGGTVAFVIKNRLTKIASWRKNNMCSSCSGGTPDAWGADSASRCRRSSEQKAGRLQAIEYPLQKGLPMKHGARSRHWGAQLLFANWKSKQLAWKLPKTWSHESQLWSRVLMARMGRKAKQQTISGAQHFE